MSVQESYKRPKGYVTWKPQAKTRGILAQVLEILQMYEAQRPLTARQIFYRLVGRYDYDKTEHAYIRLCEYLVRARRSGMVPFDWIRDDGTAIYSANGFYGVKDWFSWVEQQAASYRRDRNFYQDQVIEVWCETAGMAPQLARVAQPYGVPVYSTGGFSSVTVTHEIAQRIVREPRPTVFLHIGDFDPSGQSIYEAMSADVEAFVLQLKHMHTNYPEDGRWNHIEDDSAFIYERVALTEDQVEEYSLPTAPPKPSDKRSQSWVGETCQAEAMAPDDLAQILETTIEFHSDMDRHAVVLEREKKDREEIETILDTLPEDLENKEP